MNNLDKQYQKLLLNILENGVEKSDRTGTGTRSVFGQQIRHKMSEGFPLLTTKKMAIKTLMTELKWFLKGDTNIQYLVDNNCHIWDGDAYKNYCNVAGRVEEPDYTIHVDDPSENRTRLMTMSEFIEKIKTDDEFAEVWGELGPIYGKQWRKWPSSDLAGGVIDQIKSLIHNLKYNPDSRRLMVSAWNIDQMEDMVLPPCHYGFQVYTRKLNLDERIDYLNKTTLSKSQDWLSDQLDALGIPTRAISLMWNQRSVDTFLGLPFNIASYGMLLELLAHEVNMVPDELIGNLGDTHLYSNHLEQAREQISREPFEHLPKLKLNNVELLDGEFDYEILHYHSHPTIKAPLSN